MHRLSFGNTRGVGAQSQLKFPVDGFLPVRGMCRTSGALGTCIPRNPALSRWARPWRAYGA